MPDTADIDLKSQNDFNCLDRVFTGLLQPIVCGDLIVLIR